MLQLPEEVRDAISMLIRTSIPTKHTLEQAAAINNELSKLKPIEKKKSKKE